MHETRPRRALASLVRDLAPWWLACGAFLYAYVCHFSAPASAVWPHLQLVAAAWLAFACLKLAVPRRWLEWRTARLGLSLATSLVLGALLLYYLLVVIGLASWGRVITWPLVSAYVAQADQLVVALGYSPLLPVAALTLGFMLLWAVVHRWCMGWAWTAAIPARFTRAGFVLAVTVCALLPTTLLAKFALLPAGGSQEPLALTFRYGQGGLLQDHAKVRTFGDDSEKQARAAYTPAVHATRRNLILIVGDALRADHLGAYSYVRQTTPRLDAILRAHPFRRARMRAVCAESSCGLLGIAASRYVHRLPAQPITLQEVLRRHGYKVHLILGGDHTNFYGLRDAYGPVDSYFDGQMQSKWYMNDDRLVLDRADGLPQADPAQPVMFQFHLMSTHGLGKRHDDAKRFRPSRSYYGVLRTGEKMPATLHEEALNYYDNGVVQFDMVVDALLRTLQTKGYLDDALVVITGDHGDMLGEHDMLSHAHGVYEGVLDVPFLMVGYGFTPRTLAGRRLASQVDIAPTILAELGMPVPASWAGRPLQQPRGHDLVWFQQGKLTGVYDLREPSHQWKYWRDWQSREEFLFDIAKDPGELHNLIRGAEPARLNEWRRAIIDSGAAAGFEQD